MRERTQFAVQQISDSSTFEEEYPRTKVSLLFNLILRLERASKQRMINFRLANCKSFLSTKMIVLTHTRDVSRH